MNEERRGDPEIVATRIAYADFLAEKLTYADLWGSGLGPEEARGHIALGHLHKMMNRQDGNPSRTIDANAAELAHAAAFEITSSTATTLTSPPITISNVTTPQAATSPATASATTLTSASTTTSTTEPQIIIISEESPPPRRKGKAPAPARSIQSPSPYRARRPRIQSPVGGGNLSDSERPELIIISPSSRVHAGNDDSTPQTPQHVHIEIDDADGVPGFNLDAPDDTSETDS